MARRATKKVTEQRLDEIANLLVAGQKRNKIFQYSIENNWGVGLEQIDKLIRKTKNMLKAEGEEQVATKRTQLGKAIRRHEAIFVKCMQIQDYSRAHAAQQEINKLLALYEPQTHKHELSDNEGKPLAIAIVKMDINEL